MYCFYDWGRVEIFFESSYFHLQKCAIHSLYLGQIMASLEPQGAGKTSPIFLHSAAGAWPCSTLILATDGRSCGGREGSVRCSPIMERGKRVIGGEEWAGREQMGGWEA